MEVPAVTRYIGGTKPAPAIIGSGIKQITTNTGSLSLKRHDNDMAKILGRVGIESLGRFQHGEIIYRLEITNEHNESRIEEVVYDDILDYVSLSELEKFENAQFEQELVYEDPLAVYVKKRGRPPKEALQAVGLTSEEESESSSIPNDGILVSVPAAKSLKRRGSSSPIRGRGRPKKNKTEHVHSRLSRRDRFDHEHIALPQVKKRVKNAFIREASLINGSEDHDQALVLDLGPSDPHGINGRLPVDAGSSQLVMHNYPEDGDSHEDELNIQPSQASSHYKSSQLVAAALTGGEENLEDLHQKRLTKKRGRGRPKKNSLLVESSGNEDLDTPHARSETHKPGRPRKSPGSVSKQITEGPSSSEDELVSLHQRFGIVTRKPSSSLGNQNSPRSIKILDTHPKTTDKFNKPSPGNRPGYTAPTFSQNPPQDLGTDSSTSSQSSTSPPAHREHSSTGRQAKVPTQELIEISSGETESPSPVASYRPTSASLSTLRPSIKPSAPLTSRPREVPSATVIHDDVESVESNTESDEDDDDQEAAAITEFEIPNIPSSQSFRASVSSSSSGSDSSGEQRIQAAEVSKTSQLAGDITVPPKRQPISTQNISRQVAAQSRAAMEARKQRDGDGKGSLPKTTAPTGPGQQILRVEPSKRYRFPGKSTVPPKSPKISMQNISQQVAAKSRAEVEARKQEQAAKAALAESTSSSSDDSDSYSIPPDSPPARKPVSSTLPARTQQRETPVGVTKQNQATPFQTAFKQVSAAHQLQQQKTHQPSLPSRKATANTGSFTQSAGKSHKEPQSRSQAKLRPQQTPSSPFIPAHRESSISLGETPPHRSRIAIAREASIDLEEPKPRPTTTKLKLALSKPTDNSNHKSKPSDGSAKVEKKKKKTRRVSMTPLFPSAAGKASPVKKGRVPFSTREFEGEI